MGHFKLFCVSKATIRSHSHLIVQRQDPDAEGFIGVNWETGCLLHRSAWPSPREGGAFFLEPHSDMFSGETGEGREVNEQ